MNRLPLWAIALLFSAPLIARTNLNGTYTATAYSVRGETATGDRTHSRLTVAADPDLLPAGTRLRISGAGIHSGEYIVEDTGRKIQGRKLDIFIADVAEAKRFGKKQVRVRILKRGKADSK